MPASSAALLIALLALDVLALLHVARSSQGRAAKGAWALVVVALPMLGFALWVLFGPRRER